MNVSYELLEKNTAEATALLKAMSNQYRLMILCTLHEKKECSVSMLNQIITIPQSTLSQHLAWLRNHHFVQTRRDAQTIYYSLNSTEVIALIELLHQLYCGD